jgi:chloramphenicol O-acetyltransferase type A
MDALRPIDVSHWPRREHFEHYRDRAPCTYAMTIDVDVTELVGALHGTPVGVPWRRCGRCRPS